MIASLIWLFVTGLACGVLVGISIASYFVSHDE